VLFDVIELLLKLKHLDPLVGKNGCHHEVRLGTKIKCLIQKYSNLKGFILVEAALSQEILFIQLSNSVKGIIYVVTTFRPCIIFFKTKK
jgi:hypothetical protein